MHQNKSTEIPMHIGYEYTVQLMSVFYSLKAVLVCINLYLNNPV